MLLRCPDRPKRKVLCVVCVVVWVCDVGAWSEWAVVACGLWVLAVAVWVRGVTPHTTHVGAQRIFDNFVIISSNLGGRGDVGGKLDFADRQHTAQDWLNVPPPSLSNNQYVDQMRGSE